MKFDARFPLNHLLALVALLRSGETTTAGVLYLVAMITGELSALIDGGFSTVAIVETPNTIEACLEKLEELQNAAAGDAAFDPGIWIPIILKLIELWLARPKG